MEKFGVRNGKMKEFKDRFLGRYKLIKSIEQIISNSIRIYWIIMQIQIAVSKIWESYLNYNLSIITF